MIKVIGAKELALVSDALNQLILQKLVISNCSVTDLSKEVNVPVLKIWRRIQRLMKAKLVEVSGAEKVGNLEKKLYRATALRYDISPQFFGPKINDPDLQAVFALYAKIQNDMNTVLATFDSRMPATGDPTDFAIYALMQSFVQVFENTATKQSIHKMKEKLSNFHPQGS